MGFFTSKKKLYGELEFLYGELDRIEQLPKELNHCVGLKYDGAYNHRNYTNDVWHLKEGLIKYWPFIVEEASASVQTQIKKLERNLK